MFKIARPAAIALAVAAAFAITPATANAATAQAYKQACWDGSLQANGHDGVVPDAHRAGQKLDVSTPIKNRDSIRRWAQYSLTIDAGGKWRTVPPTVWWRVDNGGWHQIHFTWHHGGKDYDPVWDTAQMGIGFFNPGQTRTLEISTSFVWNAHPGLYWGWEQFSTPWCTTAGGRLEQGVSSVAFYYDPAHSNEVNPT